MDGIVFVHVGNVFNCKATMMMIMAFEAFDLAIETGTVTVLRFERFGKKQRVRGIEFEGFV